ncbi:MAG: GspE/PulE family protein [Candidatus Krumholzibacteria bacterium]|nr:GspE/PulE family protein [Candidatus Krumholzibacteria bacterium]MDP7021426.1 GspE/PulE family protein [Candidatus Krumholzibacteria bacterium]
MQQDSKSISPPELGEILVREGLISPSRLLELLVEEKEVPEHLEELLLRKGVLGPEELLDALACHFDYGRFDPLKHPVENAALELVPVEFSRRHQLLPLSADSETLHVAMRYPVDREALEHLRRMIRSSGRVVRIHLARAEIIEEHLESSYRQIEQTRNLSRLIDRVACESKGVFASAEAAEEEEAQRSAEEASIVRLVSQVIEQAIDEGATDIHVEPGEKGLLVRFRVDGILYDAHRLPASVTMGASSRIKILSEMDIAERRTPQDGRFSYRKGDRSVDIRASVIPTVHGEKAVLRLLDKGRASYSLRELGLGEEDYRDFLKAIRQPYGMILLSGPTGSGKTTTLYAGLSELDCESLNISTIEDPVEYQMNRINQVQVNKKKDLGFANALRAFLRQDPDVVMVGEIRDRETAEIAVRAALTGHMVFSTIHANDAPSTALRLASMGSDSFMTASALSLVIAQRLLRRNCPHCLEDYTPSGEILSAAGAPKGKQGFQRGKGCPHCKERRFAGRVAIVEKLAITPEIRQMIAENRPASEIRSLAISQGMKTLKQNGMEKALRGETTPEEVLRVCLSEE